jgi:hypothetical protein
MRIQSNRVQHCLAPQGFVRDVHTLGEATTKSKHLKAGVDAPVESLLGNSLGAVVGTKDQVPQNETLGKVHHVPAVMQSVLFAGKTDGQFER